MCGIGKSPYRLGIVRLTMLISLSIATSSGITLAGVITQPLELDSVAAVSSSSVAIPETDDEDSQLVEYSGQQFAMTVAASGGADTISIAATLRYYQLAQPKLVQWLVAQSCLVVPSPIPITLLKVSIQVL